jgi:cyclopropane fatty-acyl-phospholipid synthase-like methyltransferase
MEERRRIVEAGYNAVAADYAGLEQQGQEWPRLRLLRDVLTRVPPASAVLDLGCGNGVPALVEITSSHKAVGVDLSETQANLARANVPTAEVIQGDALELTFAPSSFAAVVALYLFDHLPREQHGDLLGRIWNWLVPGGLLLFSVEPDDEPSTVKEWLGEPMFFSHFDANTSLRLVREAGFEVLATHQETQLEGTKEVEFLWVVAKREGGHES